MLRLKKRYGLILSLAFLFSFLLMYFLINFKLPINEKKPSYDALHSKLQQLESGLKQHGQEMRNLKYRLDQTLQQPLKKSNFDQTLPKNVIFQKHPAQCSYQENDSPQVDIQMLDLYDKMSFIDIDGGVWKQGWKVEYDPLQYNEHNKLKVFVVPHSHNDPGWLKTFDDYYEHDTKQILSNAMRHLQTHSEMKFVWAEISYFSRFYEDLGPTHKQEMKKLVKEGQLEFVSGGWVMPDEANSHWLSALIQLTEGQTWLKQHFNITPKSSWAIDPFGHSPSLAYILKGAGFENMLIHRTHYSVKKELAQKKQLEFFWQQLWDTNGDTGIFTHMMPFYSYDIPHTCGPDPKICCQFDFKRLGIFGVSCPWHVPPRKIDSSNVAQKSELIVDQWRKKAELYKTNIVLVPLGDDFRYSQSTEWDAQRENYNALFDYINTNPKLHVEANFGTLQEYFDAVRKEHKVAIDFPTLTGDFFTYADRSDNYWSGYYTSRPYHKRMDRILLHYVRSAEMLHALSNWPHSEQISFQKNLQKARRELSLFQHHDGITGTAKTHVVLDYARRMFEAVQACRFVMQQAVYKLLTKPEIYNADYNFNYFFMDDSRWAGPDDSRNTIILGEELPSKHVVFHNSLAHWREEVVEFFVSSPYMSVRDMNNQHLPAQISPVWSWYRHTLNSMPSPQASTTKYRLLFKVRIPPLGLSTYIIHIEASDIKLRTTYANNLILSENPMSIYLGEYPQEVKFGKHREILLHVDNGPSVAFSKNGMMKSIQIEQQSSHIPVQIKFYKYGTRMKGEQSGAYLFLPGGPATPLEYPQTPVVIITEGFFESSVIVGLPHIVHQTILRGGAPEIRNLVDISELDDTEIVMRLMTSIKNSNTFYTDLNGLQIIKRRRLRKIPTQANYYPIPSAAYIEDENIRLTLLNAQPLGGSSLSEGELEVMQDRRLKKDDERGLGQGVLDNQPVLHIFRVLLERIQNCRKLNDGVPYGALTMSGYRESKSLLHPVDKFIFAENDWLGVQPQFGKHSIAADEDIEVMVIRELSSRKSQQNIGLLIHRTNLINCPTDGHQTGMLDLWNLLAMEQNTLDVYNSTFTFLKRIKKINNKEISLCPMDTQAL